MTEDLRRHVIVCTS